MNFPKRNALYMRKKILVGKTRKIFVIMLANLLFSCNGREPHPVVLRTAGVSDSTNPVITNLTESQLKILSGAKKCLEEKFTYDDEMAYRVLEYRNGEYVGGSVYPGGDIDPGIGVCTEVVIRTLRYAGIVDLQKAVHEELLQDFDAYPMKRWNAKKPDTNIDHRRVPNLLVWFSRNWSEPAAADFEPGDVIIWDMNSDGWADHIGIVSDKYHEENLLAIHNFPSPGYVAEEDVLFRWEIVGHFRLNY